MGRVGVRVKVGVGGAHVPVGVGVDVGALYCLELYGKQWQLHAVAVAIAEDSDMAPPLHPTSVKAIIREIGVKASLRIQPGSCKHKT